MNLLYEEVLTIELSFIEKTVTSAATTQFRLQGPTNHFGHLAST